MNAIRILAFPTDGLSDEQDELRNEFPDWDITYKIDVDGFTWAMPRGVTWMAQSGTRVVTSGSAQGLRTALK